MKRTKEVLEGRKTPVMALMAGSVLLTGGTLIRT